MRGRPKTWPLLAILLALLALPTAALAEPGEHARELPAGATDGATELPLALAPKPATAADAAAAPSTGPVPLGSALSNTMYGGLQGVYSSTFLANFDSLTPEIELKMDMLRPSPTTWNFGPADGLLAYAEANGRPMRGHTLVWEHQIPAWVRNRQWTRDELRAYLKDYVQTVVRRYRGRIHEWDVVNEPLGLGGGIGRTFWQRNLGDGYIADVLRWVREVDPNTRLFLNEWGAERAGLRQDGLARLVERLQRERVPLDGIGFEAHVASRSSPGALEFAGTLRRFANYGLEVQVTEADVRTKDMGPAATDQARDEASGTAFAKLALGCSWTPRCTRMTVWGVSDATSWLGADQRPLLWDAQWRRKPGYQPTRGALQRR